MSIPFRQPGRAAVIGAGLAGASVAASLARRGWQAEVFDAAPHAASGASGLPAGLCAVNQSPDDNMLSRLTRAGVALTLRECERLLVASRDWQPSGILEKRMGDARRPPREDEWTRVTPEGDWWHEKAAWIRPGALVEAWLREPGIVLRTGRRVELHGDELAGFDVVVVAAAYASRALLQGRIELNPVRGQVSWSRNVPNSAPPHPVNGHGHFVSRGDIWLAGSTYGRGEESLDVREEDHATTLDKLRVLLPQVAAELAPQFASGQVQAWTGVRCTSRDRRPVVGHVEGRVWVSTAMGSRGLSFCVLAAELIAAQLQGEAWPVDAALGRALSPARFAA